MIRPLTIGECDEQLVQTHENYIRAEQRLDFDAAFNLWTDLMRLLEVRIRLPLPRQSPENGGPTCPLASEVSTSTASPASDS